MSDSTTLPPFELHPEHWEEELFGQDPNEGDEEEGEANKSLFTLNF